LRPVKHDRESGREGRKREREREKWGRERDNDGGGRKRHGSFEKMVLVDITVGLNQHLGILGGVNQ
jgi:hypothetical protein